MNPKHDVGETKKHSENIPAFAVCKNFYKIIPKSCF